MIISWNFIRQPRYGARCTEKDVGNILGSKNRRSQLIEVSNPRCCFHERGEHRESAVGVVITRPGTGDQGLTVDIAHQIVTRWCSSATDTAGDRSQICSEIVLQATLTHCKIVDRDLADVGIGSLAGQKFRGDAQEPECGSAKCEWGGLRQTIDGGAVNILLKLATRKSVFGWVIA